MALLLPCRDEISAHLLRSRLLELGVETTVLHDHAATLWGNCGMHTTLLIALDDFEQLPEFIAELQPVADSEFGAASDEDETDPSCQESFDASYHCFSMLALAVTGFVMGFLAGGATTFAIGIFGATRDTYRGIASRVDPAVVAKIPMEWALWWAYFAVALWPMILLARWCRVQRDGRHPVQARVIFLLLLVYGDLGWIFALLYRFVFTFLPEPLRSLLSGASSWL